LAGGCIKNIGTGAGFFPEKTVVSRLQNQNRSTTMGVTRLKRKDRVNKAVANNRVAQIKRLQQKPIIKNVDVEAIKAEFAAKAGKA